MYILAVYIVETVSLKDIKTLSSLNSSVLNLPIQFVRQEVTNVSQMGVKAAVYFLILLPLTIPMDKEKL